MVGVQIRPQGSRVVVRHRREARVHSECPSAAQDGTSVAPRDIRGYLLAPSSVRTRRKATKRPRRDHHGDGSDELLLEQPDLVPLALC
jgi:hypothetical protein